MTQILRLRGPDQIYGARGWSLFRLSHHRLVRTEQIRTFFLILIFFKKCPANTPPCFSKDSNSPSGKGRFQSQRRGLTL